MDLDLLERCRARDREAFRALVAHWGDRALRTAFAFTRDRERAAAAVREAFLGCWDGLPSFHSERAFRPWFMGLVARSAVARAGEGRRCIDRLDGDERIAVVLRAGGLPAPEVAAALGLTRVRGRRVLRLALEELAACRERS